MKRLTIFLSVLMLMFSVYATAAEKMLIAVMDLKGKGLPMILAGAVTDIIRSEMVKTGLYTVVERSQMDEILKEQGFQQTGCTDQSCAVQLGKLLSARKILIGEINKVGTAIMITIRIVDVEKGVSEYSANEKALSEDVLDAAARKLTQDLSLNIVEGNKEFFMERKSAGGYYIRGIIPGLGQYYADRTVWGSVYIGSFILSGAYLGYTVFAYKNAKQDYDNLSVSATSDDFSSKRKLYKDAAKNVNIALGVFGAVYILNWVDLFIFKPNFSRTNTAASDTYFMNIAIMPYANDHGVPEQMYSLSCGIRF